MGDGIGIPDLLLFGFVDFDWFDGLFTCRQGSF
jgi:hypothetical protein